MNGRFMNEIRQLGLEFSSRKPKLFNRLHNQFNDPTTRSQSIISKIRKSDPTIALLLYSKGMVLRLFWFFNFNVEQPKCPICFDKFLKVRLDTRKFSSYCSLSCRNRDPSFQEKAFARFGGHPMRDPVVKAKTKATWKRNFQGGHPSRDLAVRLRMCGFKRKHVTDIYGDAHTVQGYEDQVISNLICSRVSTDPQEVPVIRYTYGGQRRSYFPDMIAYMPLGDGSILADGNHRTRIIEVKSVWTFLKDFEQNVAKFLAAVRFCVNQVYTSFWVVIVLKTGELLWSKNPDREKLIKLKRKVS